MLVLLGSSKCFGITSRGSVVVCDVWGVVIIIILIIISMVMIMIMIIIVLLQGHFLFRKKIEEISIVNRTEYLLSFLSDLSVEDLFE